MARPLGVYFLTRSRIDPSSMVAVVFTGGKRASKNSKTGAMVQAWVLHAGHSPMWAVRTGADHAVCGACPMRRAAGYVDVSAQVDGAPVGACYVNVSEAPTQVFKAFRAGSYVQVSGADDPALVAYIGGQHLRVSAYGDPMAIDPAFWVSILTSGVLAGWTGYTHAWRDPAAAPLRPFIMASVDTTDDRDRANREGWLTFRSKRAGDPVLPGEIYCPSSRGATCKRCRKCGSRAARDVTINVHGSMARGIS